jgi:hypothetical protein
VSSYIWDFGDGITQADTSPVVHYYTFVPTGGSTKAKLTVYGQGKTCPYSTEKTINLKDVFADFLPSTESAEKEMQELAAILECTDRQFLPPEIVEKIDAAGGRGKIEERYAMLRRMVEMR